MRKTLLAIFAATTLLGCPTTGGDDSEPGEVENCEPSDLPVVSDAVTTPARVYDPDSSCWRSVDVELVASYWGAYASSDTGGVECDDVELMVPRIDCSCVLLSSRCGDTAAAVASDPSVDTSEAAGQRCAQASEVAPECE